jgi:hypothetical protein
MRLFRSNKKALRRICASLNESCLIAPMSEHCTHHHDHNHHNKSYQDDGLLALHAEDLYSAMLRRVRHNGWTSFATEVSESSACQAARQRLGHQAAGMAIGQQHLVSQLFEDHYPALPRTEEHHHAHGHDHGPCGKRHGPLQRLVERIEHGTLTRVKHRRAKMAAALIFRAGLFTMCPGDDIAAIGLQTYSSIAGHHQEHDHHEAHPESQAILPRRPRVVVDLEAGYADVDMPRPEPVPVLG